MNIVVASAFRNMESNLRKYFKRINALAQLVDKTHKIRLIAAEGDSKDNTRVQLSRMSGHPIEIVDATHGGPNYGSTEHPERMKALSYVLNRALSAVKDTDDVFVYVESDLIWDAPTMSALIEHAINWRDGFDVFAPMIFAGEHFYDVWGFRKDGCRFGPFPPYHHGLNGQITEVESVGSCLVMRANVARKCRVRNDYALVGWCEDVRNQGFRIAVCPDLKIRHP